MGLALVSLLPYHHNNTNHIVSINHDTIMHFQCRCALFTLPGVNVDINGIL